MQVLYCDLCGVPLKNVIHLLTVQRIDNVDVYTNPQSVKDALYGSKPATTAIKEICSECKVIMDLIFQYRRNGLAKLSKYLDQQFRLPSAEVKKPKKKKKKLPKKD